MRAVYFIFVLSQPDIYGKTGRTPCFWCLSDHLHIKDIWRSAKSDYASGAGRKQKLFFQWVEVFRSSPCLLWTGVLKEAHFDKILGWKSGWVWINKFQLLKLNLNVVPFSVIIETNLSIVDFSTRDLQNVYTLYCLWIS